MQTRLTVLELAVVSTVASHGQFSQSSHGQSSQLHSCSPSGKLVGFPTMLVRVLYHDHCFDGAASAAYFSRFIAEAVHPGAEFRYTGMAHKAAQSFDPALFDG